MALLFSGRGQRQCFSYAKNRGKREVKNGFLCQSCDPLQGLPWTCKLSKGDIYLLYPYMWNLDTVDAHHLILESQYVLCYIWSVSKISNKISLTIFFSFPHIHWGYRSQNKQNDKILFFSKIYHQKEHIPQIKTCCLITQNNFCFRIRLPHFPTNDIICTYHNLHYFNQ